MATQRKQSGVLVCLWLAICYKKLGDKEKAKEYLDRATATIGKDGKIPELYFSHTDEANENNPLGWSESMYVAALFEVEINP